MIFGFGKQRDDDDEEDDEGEEIEYVLFQGALNGKEANLTANARLAQAGLIPTKEVVTDAIQRRAEQLRIEPKGDRAILQVAVDGVLHSLSRMSKAQGHAVTQMVKLLAGLNIQQRQRPQSGGIRAELEGTKYELRVVTTPVAEGVERLVVKIKNLDKAPKTAEEVGFSREIKTRVRAITERRKGLLLACGGPGSGVSTTLFAILRSVDAYQYTIYTVGDRQGWELPNVGEMSPEDGEDLASVLERALRAEGDVIYADPIRTPETAQLLAKLADRACFVAELPAPDAISGILQFGKLVGDNAVAADALAGTVSQRLIRTLCKSCRLAYRPNPKILAKIGLPPETKTLYRPPPPPSEEPERGAEEPEPCEECGGDGYLGRTAIFEVIEITDELKKLIASGAPAAELKAMARKEKAISLQQEGLKLVVEGKTSLEELQRLFRPK